MNRKQPDYSTSERVGRRDLAKIHQTLKNAEIVMELSSGVISTAAALVNRIPKGAPNFTSPAGVNSLAVHRGKSEDTIRNHIAKLVEAGLAENTSLGNGRRLCMRDQHGAIVEVYGVSFGPMMARSDELACRVETLRADQVEHMRLRCEVSRCRRGMGRVIDEYGCDKHRHIWAGLPRRLTKLTLTQLRKLIHVVKQLKTALNAIISDEHRVEVSQDRPRKNAEQYTTEQSLSVSCNPAMPAEKSSDCGQTGAKNSQPTCGLEHVTLKMMLTLAPDDWQTMMDMNGRPSVSNLIGTAYQRARDMDVSPSAWAQAQATIGPLGAALLVLLADVQSSERGGKIRSPGGWVRRMSERAESGTAHLHRTVYGLLHSKDAPCYSAI